MSYIKQGFKSGQTLQAAELNSMDDGIANANVTAGTASQNASSAAASAQEAYEKAANALQVATGAEAVAKTAVELVLSERATILHFQNGTGEGSVQQFSALEENVFYFHDLINERAPLIDPTLKGNISYGAKGKYSITLGGKSTAIGDGSISSGEFTIAKGHNSHTEGYGTVTLGNKSHAEGDGTTAQGGSAHSEGYWTLAEGSSSHSEGTRTHAKGPSSHAEGGQTVAHGSYSHTEGFATQVGVLAMAAHAEGNSSKATGASAHAEGSLTIAQGDYSHAEGIENQAIGIGSHVGGGYNIANYDYQTVVGYYNKNSSGNIFEVGNGLGKSASARSNAFAVSRDGRAKVYGAPIEDEDVVRLKDLTHLENLFPALNNRLEQEEEKSASLQTSVITLNEQVNNINVQLSEITLNYKAEIENAKQDAIGTAESKANAYTERLLSWKTWSR